MKKNKPVDRSAQLLGAHGALVNYLLTRVVASDWHGVSDAANDLRVLEQKMLDAGVAPPRVP